MFPTHGKIKLKKDILCGDTIIKESTVGLITMFSPNTDSFAVLFPNGKWIPFTELSFDEYCDIIERH